MTIIRLPTQILIKNKIRDFDISYYYIYLYLSKYEYIENFLI